jgi:ankyrin repeat protein/penicillin V acylase-like amidase (Ntn superfamily)
MSLSFILDERLRSALRVEAVRSRVLRATLPTGDSRLVRLLRREVGVPLHRALARRLALAIWPFLLAGLSFCSWACSTVLLKTETVLVLGHNLDESVDFAGFIVVNKRDVYKVGTTWQDFRTCDQPLRPSIGWVSRHGSVTWSGQGRDLPDGGINEAGLSIEEMSLGDHPYLAGGIRPRLFQMQWIQYHLDQFDSVDQVIKSASVVFPNGWPWHFLVVDKHGQCATLEYIRNRLVVHTGQSLPVTALCNSPYAEELAGLEQYRGFGGRRTIDLSNKQKHPRFVRAAHLLRDYDPRSATSGVAHMFGILENLGGPMTRRSYVIDMKNRTVHFRTASHPQARHFSLTAFDFSSDTPVQMLDLNTPDTGDVRSKFRDYSPAANRRIAESWVHHARQIHPKASESDHRDGGRSLDHIERYAHYAEISLAKNGLGSAANAYGLDPLSWAAYRGDLHSVRGFADRKEDVNARTHLGVTALIAAAQSGNPEVVRLLVERGAELDATDKSGNSALITALAFGHSEIARDLIRKNADFRRGNRQDLKALHYAAANGDIETVRLLLERGAEVNASSETGFTILMAAAEAGWGETIRRLIAKGADINARDGPGDSALLWSVRRGHLDAAKALLDAGADVQVTNHEGITPWKAASNNKDKQLQQLLKKGRR